jgi:tetratricopeptide (TPR) repeat protein
MKTSDIKYTICFLLTTGLLIACSSREKVTQKTFDPQAAAELIESGRINEDPEQLNALTEYYYGRQKFEKALECTQQVLAVQDTTIHSDRAYYNRGRIYADVLNFRMDLKKAAAAFRMVISTPPVSKYDKLAEEELRRIKK